MDVHSDYQLKNVHALALDAIQKAKSNKDAYFDKLTMSVRHGRN